jgi:23S rRNA (pseudouridine1915-N3)-methyltransferase
MPVFPLHLRLIVIGKLRGSIWLPAVTEYCQRVQHYAKLDLIEIRDSVGKGLPDTTALIEEGKAIVQFLEPANYLIALDRAGKSRDSEEFAQLLRRQIDGGIRKIDFLIGGPVGIDEKIIEKANFKLTLSTMTLPHELARVVLLEQLYRAFTILRGEPYHK